MIKEEKITVSRVVKKAKVRKRFLAVDVWRSEFGPVSVRAIYDIYSQRFNVNIENMNKFSLPQCINALRKLEDSDYEEPQDEASY